MSLLSLKTEILGSVLIIRLKGELDHHTATQLRNLFDKVTNEQKDINHLILNFRDLTFMDSSGLGVILGRYKDIERRKGKMAVCSPNPIINRILEMAGLYKIVSIAATEKEALIELGVA